MDAPPITVIIPTRDRAHFLAEAIDSALAQTRADFELIVVDDGSRDATPAVLAGIRDPRLRVVRQAARGIGAAMNAGLRAARGAYVARLDSDDVWRPELLAALSAVLDARAEVGVAYGRGQAMDARGRLLAHVQGMPMRFPGDAWRSMAFDDFTCNVALLARRPCIERAGGYDESLPANEDWDLWLRVAREAQFAFVDRVLVHIRWHAGNLTGVRSPALATVLATRSAPLDKLFAEPELPAAMRSMRSLAYENVHIACAMRWWHAGQPRRAAQRAAGALRVSASPPRAALRLAWFVFTTSRLGRSPAGRRLAAGLRARFRR